MLVGDGYHLLPKLKIFQNKEQEKNNFCRTHFERNEIKNYYAAGDIFVYASKSGNPGHDSYGSDICGASNCGC